MRTLAWSVASLFVLGSGVNVGCLDTVDDSLGAETAEQPLLVRCTERPFTAPARERWRSWANAALSLFNAPAHTAQDLVTPATDVRLEASFAYGWTSSALKGERVRVYVDDCGGWVDLGTSITSGSGAIALPAELDLAPGAHAVRFVVLGDGSTASATLWALPEGTHVAVSDIDGTLTTSDGELIHQILDATYVPQAFPGAAALTTAHADRGHVVVYLTGRGTGLLDKTRTWLDDLGFAPGPVHVTSSAFEGLPLDAGVGEYKRKYLQSLVDAGYIIDLAYGNATTDVYAYYGAHLSADEVWVIGPNAGYQGSHAVVDSWVSRAAEVAGGPTVDQPF